MTTRCERCGDEFGDDDQAAGQSICADCATTLDACFRELADAIEGHYLDDNPVLAESLRQRLARPGF